MKTALRVNTDFTTEVLDLDADEYQQLSDAVGGLIQPVDLKTDLAIIVNEEGKLISLPVNVIGTHMWYRSYGATDVMVGNVVFTGGTDYETGETRPLPHAWLAQLEEFAEHMRSAMEGGVVV